MKNSTSYIQNTIKSLIAEGCLGKAVDFMEEYSNFFSAFSKERILISRRYNNYVSLEIMGLLPYDELELIGNRISVSIIKLLDRVVVLEKKKRPRKKKYPSLL